VIQHPENLKKLTDEGLQKLMADVVRLQREDVKESALLYYEPVSDQAMKVHLSDADTIGVGGGNRCVPLYAPVLMADGNYKPLCDIKIGDEVIGADPESGKAIPVKVLNTFRSGRKPVYRVSFSDGGYFDATAEHQVPMYLGSGKTTTKGNLKKPFKRILGDYISPILNRKSPEKRISCVSPKNIQLKKSKDLFIHPYLLGALLGDGTITGQSPKFHNIDEDVIERVRGHIEDVGCTLVKYQGADFGITNINQVGSRRDKGCFPNNVKKIIKGLSLWGCTSYTKFIPEEAFALSRRERKELLAGLIDTDGAESSYSTCSNQLAQDFVRLVRSLGGKATNKKHISRSQNGTEVEYFQIYWRMNERLPLSLSYKQPKNSKREVDYSRRVCQNVELLGTFECGDIEVDHPAHCYVTGDYVIVSNSSKTETCLVDMIVMATGVIPNYLQGKVEHRFRGPINCRVVCESLTTVLHPIILPKLQWMKWTGVDRQGGKRGHWGWIPKSSLIDGDWDKSWSEKLRMLRFLCRDPETGEEMGESTIQFMSIDQDPSDFASGEFQIILHDEPPKFAQWRENRARAMSVDGRMFLAMSWPDDPTIAVDWIFDEIYDKGQGVNKADSVEWITLDTRDNRYLRQDAVSKRAAEMGESERATRIMGQPIRFSNRIHPLFTDTEMQWCPRCKKTVITVTNLCGCGSEVDTFCHVTHAEPNPKWPTIFMIDPHPRKPHMMMWVQVDPHDDLWQIAELDIDDDPDEVVKAIDNIESELGVGVVLRYGDPNMLQSPASAKRNITWRDEFFAAGLALDLADNSDVGRGRVNEYLKPDTFTHYPRINIDHSCKNTIQQFKRYSWDDYRNLPEKDMKQKPKQKNDDYPTLWKYLLNTEPTFRFLKGDAPVIRYAR